MSEGNYDNRLKPVVEEFEMLNGKMSKGELAVFGAGYKACYEDILNTLRKGVESGGLKGLEKVNEELVATLEMSDSHGVFLAGKLAHIHKEIKTAMEDAEQSDHEELCGRLLMFTMDYRNFKTIGG